jgi:translation initiation factor IF-2
MRVYEYAKKHNKSSKEVLAALRSRGFDLANHMAQLTNEMIATLSSTQSSPQKASSKAPVGKNPAAKTVPAGSGAPKKGADKPAGKSDSKPAGNAPSGNKPAKKTNSKGGNKKREQGKGQKNSGTQAPARNHRISRETLISAPLVEMVSVKHELSVPDAAALFKKPVSEVVYVLLRKGLLRNIFAILPVEELQLLGSLFGIEVIVEASDEADDVFALDKKKVEAIEKTEERLPVVVVMGHVDHGKTTLLDYLRKTNVVSREKGGITQHVSAYEVKAGSRNVIFLDTPGHEAFSHMRTKGTRVTDVAIVIVSAVEGIKPQTVEAIELARKAGVPILVAVNKIDRLQADSQLDTLWTQLSQHGLTPEEWGGDTVCVKISAKTGEGVDDLLEMLGLMTDLLDLKTSSKAPVDGFVLESKQVKGHGLAVTVLCRQGTLKKGDYFVCGKATGRVRLLIDSAGKFLKEVGPSVPVQVVGFDSNQSNLLGDYLSVVTQTQYADAKAASKKGGGAPLSQTTVVTESEDEHEVRLLCKADMQGSCQAIIDAVSKMEKSSRNSAIKVTLFSCDVGPISENDVLKASDLNAHLFGLHVRPDKNAILAAKARGVEINQYDIIYHMFEHIERLLLEERRKIVRVVEAGKAEVLKVFPIKGHKVIAGCMIKEGVLRIGDKVECIRAKTVIGSGIVTSLQRDKREIKEVHEGYDCGFLTDTFHGWQVGDRITISTHEKLED